jgi:ubiquinone/menaquinone biosynthesis C-methylase UbiE
MTTPPSTQYDDPVFFRRYQTMRLRGAGFNEDLEQPAMARMLPGVTGADVLDIGCGDGTLARRLASQGARRVLGIDPSARMLALAASHPRPQVRYCRASAETVALAPACLDLVVSSLALHYVAGYGTLIRRIAGWLRPGGHLIYSVEHPICTARDPMTGWIAANGSTVWPVDDYARETTRTQRWLGTVVTKRHRRLTTLVGGLLAAGLILTGIDEPYPDDHTVARRPDIADHCRRPPLLLLSAQKPPRPGASSPG